MKTVFGKLLVYLALKLRIPIFVVYYAIISLWLVLLAGFSASGFRIERVAELLSDGGVWFLLVVFYGIFPFAWTFTSGGWFWKVPNEQTASELFDATKNVQDGDA